MRALVRAELVALRTTPTAIRLLAVTLAASLFLAVSYLGVKDLELTSAGDAERGVQTALVGGFVLFFGGIVAGTTGHRYGTLPALALLAPSRRAVLLAQAATVAAASAFAGLVCAAVVTALVLVLVGAGGGDLPSAGAVVRVVVALPVHAALAGVGGYGLGALVRSQPAALALGLVLVLAVEPSLATFSELVDRIGPTAAASGLAGIDEADLPGAAVSLALLAAYAVVLLTAGVAATERRDL